MTTLEKIVKAAKAMKKAHPKKYAKWTDYVKAASKQISGLDSVKRSGNKTTVNYSRNTAIKKKSSPKKNIQAKLFGVKKTPTKSVHKDTGSHNVRIRVVSGIKSNDWMNELNHSIKVLREKERVYNWHKEMSTNKLRNAELRKSDKNIMAIVKAQISVMKKHITEVKKHIK